MSDAQRPEPLSLVVLTGFLGAGKTSLLNQWVADPALADAVVMINEFGEIALDHQLIEKVSDEIITLPSGCVCCAVRGDFAGLLINLLKRRDNGRISLFRRVVLETTGVADPGPILAAVRGHPYLSLRYPDVSVLTVVDAINGAATLVAHEVNARQIAAADALILTKTDLAPDRDDVTRLRASLESVNPLAAILDAQAGEASASAVIAAVSDAPRPASRRSAATDVEPPPASHGVRSFTLTSATPVRAEQLDVFLELLQTSKGPDLLRVKGLVFLAQEPETPLVIHVAQSVMHPPRLLERWPDDDRSTRLVFIVRDIEPDFVASLWDAFGGDGQIERR
ncbi:GTP-binding protein [Terrarubrum flagellatum]|uniref:CobW family GTP-binding protein n=1 Tax=Terrirubrum flagellatum TaxID=2895980 RepID=UPI00314533A3